MLFGDQREARLIVTDDLRLSAFVRARRYAAAVLVPDEVVIPEADVDAVGDHEGVGAVFEMNGLAQQWLRVLHEELAARHEGGADRVILT